MILRPEFHREPDIDRTLERQKLGLPADQPVGLVLFGGAGAPVMESIAERLPRTLGADDDVSTFDPSLHPLVASQWAQYGAGMRTPSVGVVLEVLVAAILEQRVTGQEARSSWRWLLRRHGEPAPGPAPEGMR